MTRLLVMTAALGLLAATATAAGTGDPGQAGIAAEQPEIAADGATALEADPELVRQVQQKLAEEGYLQGGVEGRFDDATREALGRYQEQRALRVTGEIDRETLASLGVESGMPAADGEPAEQAAEAPAGARQPATPTER